MIVTVTPNPALDKTAVVPGFTLGRIFRVAEPQWLPGGKGFNVARSLRVLGLEALVVAPLAGHIGAMVRDLAQAEGLQLDCVWFAGETRTCQSVIDPTTGGVTELYEMGPPLPGEVWEQIIALVRKRLPAAQAVTVSGGFPRGVPLDGLRRIVELAQAAGVPVLLDTYGEHLVHALAAQPALVKCNQHEASEIVGDSIDEPAGALAAARTIQRRGARDVVITLGAQGVVGIDRTGLPFAWGVPPVHSISAVGSGDAFLAGLVAEQTRGQPLRCAARYGVAVGAANTVRAGAGMFERVTADALLKDVPALTVG